MPQPLFDHFEKQLLLTKVEELIQTLESKECNYKVNVEKQKAYKVIATRINALGRGPEKDFFVFFATQPDPTRTRNYSARPDPWSFDQIVLIKRTFIDQG